MAAPTVTPFSLRAQQRFHDVGGLQGLVKPSATAVSGQPRGAAPRNFGLGSFYTPGSSNRFISAKDIPYKEPGVVANFYGMTPDNIFAPGQFLNKFQRDAVEKGITTGGNRKILSNLRSSKNLLGQNPEQATLLRQYLNTGQAPAELSPQFAIDAYDWAIREEGRHQQTKRPSLFKQIAGPVLTIGSAFLPGGQFIAPVVGGITGGITGGVKGGILGALGGLGAGHAAGAIKGAGTTAAGAGAVGAGGSSSLANIGRGIGTLAGRAGTAVAANPITAIGSGLKSLVVPSTTGVYGTGTLGSLAGFGSGVANVLGSPGGQFLTSVGTSLATPLPKYEGTILGPDAPPVLLTTQNFPGAQVAPVSQGVGSLPLATSGYQNPTPYSGVAPLSPAFISQAGQGTAAPSPSSGLAPLGAAFMNQFERAKLGLT
jgi:hypothetical protein